MSAAPVEDGTTTYEETKSLLRKNDNNIDNVLNRIEEPSGNIFSNIPLKAFILAAAGNFFEYYDFGLLGYFTDGLLDFLFFFFFFSLSLHPRVLCIFLF